MNTPTQDLIDWLRSEADRHTNSVAARDVAVQQHIATLRAWAIHVAALSTPVEAKRGTDAQIEFERKLTCEAINGAMAFGYQNTNPPPDDDHWLAPFWNIGRERAQLEAKAALPSDAAQAPIEPAGEASSMPGTEGFTTAIFEAAKVPVGTKV